MRETPLILIVDDNATNLDILETRLTAHGYEILTADGGEEALAINREKRPDLILLDVMMPKMDGIEVCRRIKADPSLPWTPIILVTAKADSKDIIAGLEAGSDEYITKPVDQTELVARVKSILRLKALHDTVQDQAAQLEQWNRKLEQRVDDQLAEIERIGRLKRFLSPQIAEAVVSSGDDSILNSHRRDITVLFCDLRGFTAFSETAEPEDVMGVLREYHEEMGPLIFHFEGTVERFQGDGIMVFFNDPVPCPDAVARAVGLATAMRSSMDELRNGWRRRGFKLGFGVGIAQGFATLGTVGFEGRFEYSAIGSVANLASRLCDKAENGQILASQKVYTAVEHMAEVEPIGEASLKGFHEPVSLYNVVGLKQPAGATTAR